jgi:hypothetical protein
VCDWQCAARLSDEQDAQREEDVPEEPDDDEPDTIDDTREPVTQ